MSSFRLVSEETCDPRAWSLEPKKAESRKKVREAMVTCRQVDVF